MYSFFFEQFQFRNWNWKDLKMFLTISLIKDLLRVQMALNNNYAIHLIIASLSQILKYVWHTRIAVTNSA